MTHEKYAELICLCICGTDVAGEAQPLTKFKAGQTERCPSCGGNVWSHFNPAFSDIAVYETALSLSRRN